MSNSVKLTASEKKSLFVLELSTITKAILDSDLKRFENSEVQARYVAKAHLWLKSASGKALMVREKCGIREVIKGNFPFDKTQYYHLLEFAKFAEAKPELLKQWKKEVCAIKEQKVSIALSTTEYVKYYKEATLEGEGEGKPKPKGKEKALFSFTKGAISVRMIGGELKGKAKLSEVISALEEVKAMLEALTKPKATAKATAKPKPKPTAKAKAKAKAKALTMQDVVIQEEVELIDSPF
jgi:hypothetical protein